MKERIRRRSGKTVILPLLLAIIMSVPVFTVGQDTEETYEVMDQEDPMFPGLLDFASLTMEQYIGGDFAYDQLGYSSAKGDFNDDGIEDIALGAPGFNGTRGGVFMFFGGSETRIMSYNDAPAMIDNSEVGSYFGMKLKVGDVDNDGLDDLLVGGYADAVTIPDLLVEDRIFTEYPKVYLFLGKDGWPRYRSSFDADAIYRGSSPEHLFGWDIELGDVTGDGYDDVLISEIDPWVAPEGGSGGSGGPIDWETNIALDATASHSGGGSGVWGAAQLNNGDSTGTSNDCWTSANGWVMLDWEDEVWVGGMKIYYTRWRNLGSNYCLHRCTVQYWDGDAWQDDQDYDDGNYGSNNDHVIEMTTPVKTSKLRLYGMYAGSNVMIQEWEVFPAQGSSIPYVPHPDGRVYVFDGADTINGVYNVSYEMNEDAWDHIIHNSDNSSGFANSDIDLGDINGDGNLDVLIGSSGVQFSGRYAGGVQGIFGGLNLPKNLDILTYSHVNITSFTNFKLSTVTTADINGDGIDDLITCAPMGFLDLMGGIFIFYGDTLMNTTPRSLTDYDLMIRGPYPEADIGVKGIPDMNGDGRDEIMVLLYNAIDTSGVGSYSIIYSSSLDDLNNDVFYMHLQDVDINIMGASKEKLFAHRALDNFFFIDFNGDGTDELFTTLPMGSLSGNPPESGVGYLYYHEISEIQYLDFKLLDADGENGDILGAGEVYHFEGYVKNTWNLNDITLLDLTFLLHGGVMEGEKIILFWDRGLMKMNERSDPNEFIEIESSSFNPDGNDGMWIYFNVSFNPIIPTEEPMDLLVDIQGGRAGMATSLSYGSMFKVEPDVDFYGDFDVIGEYNGKLSKGDYVRPNEKITVTGLKAVYEGTDISPPNDYFGVKLTDNVGNVFINKSSSGKEIYFTYRTQDIAGREDLNLTFVDLIGTADNAAGLITFFYIVDIDVPDPPEEVMIRADSDIDDLIGYDNDPEVFVTWNPAQDMTSEIIGYMYSFADGGGTDQGIFTENTQAVIPNLREGWNEIFVWSVDSASNFGPSQVATVYYDTEMPVFGMPNPAPGSWVNTRTVNYEMTINDIDGSGVRGSTVEYAVSFDGGKTFSAWEPTNLRNEGEQVKVKVFLNFREGDENFIKWRAKDISGNGYIISDPFQVKVDTNPISFKAPIPVGAVEEDYISCGITITDIGAGVDGTTVEYSISYDGVSNYGPWESLDLGVTDTTMIISTPPIFFEKDTLNYIRWRAKDGAGNGFTYSDDYPIDVKPESINRDPVPIILEPVPNTKYLETKEIFFDGSSSVDPDNDELSFFWYSDKDGYLGTDPTLNKRLSQDNHLITLHVFDGISNRSISIKVSVIPDPSSIDTDNDGIPDFNDDDDDNDGLYDIEEDLNKNGLYEPLLNETDPKIADTDGDGYNDRIDVAPLDDSIQVYEDERNLPLWLAILVFIVAMLLLAVAAILFVLKQRVEKKKSDARRNLRRTRRNVRRFEVLTGVPTNDLPAIEAVQWALPGVINEASEFMLDTVPSDDLLPEAPEDVPQEEEKKPELEDMEVPETSMPPTEPVVGGEEVPGPEMPEAPEPEVPPAEGGKMVNCSLCGSEIPVEEGAASVECPLCGEINNL